MKKSVSLFLALLLCLTLGACGAAAPTAAATPAPTAAATVAPTATAAPTAAAATAAPESSAQSGAEARKELAKSLIGRPVQELYDAIGQPGSCDYGSSCLVKDAQDGELVYDGFTVYTTLLADGTETVYDVE